MSRRDGLSLSELRRAKKVEKVSKDVVFGQNNIAFKTSHLKGIIIIIR